MGKINKQAGFSGVELVMASVIVILIVAVGTLVYKNHNKSSKPAVVSTTSTTNASTKASTETTPPTSSTTTTSATNQAPVDCPKVAQTSVAVFLTLNANGADKPCMQVTKDEDIGVDNETGKSVTVTIGPKTVTIPTGSSTGFDGEVGGYLQAGKNIMQVSTYSASQYPAIWLY